MPKTKGANPATAVREIREVIENWVIFRDAALWDEFAQLWHSDGHMSATWFQGTARDFIDVSREGFDRGVRILHFLGGSSIEVAGERAIAQTKMTITQRSQVHSVEVDVVCTGRIYDFLAVENGDWKLVRRQPIYERDRMDPVDPSATLELDKDRLLAWPEGYRYLAYLQAEDGFSIKDDLPGLTGPAVEQLYREGRGWLSGSERPGAPGVTPTMPAGSPAFEFETAAARVAFGRGSATANVGREVARLRAQRIMLIAASHESDLARQLTEPVRDRVVEVFDAVRPHVPHEVAIAAQDLAARSQADLLVSVGGGSTTGTAKIIARMTGTPILSVPTTCAGSEMTPVWGMTTNGVKETGKDPRVGMTTQQLDTAVDLVAQKLPIDNPRPVSDADIRSILRSAHEGGDA